MAEKNNDLDLIEYAYGELEKLKISYGDIKWFNRSFQSLQVKNGQLEINSNGSNKGIGIKILFNGSYGFAATNVLTKDSLQNTVKRALKIAQASSLSVKNPIVLAEEPVYTDTVKTPIKQDPDKVPIDETIDILLEASKQSDIGDSRIKVRSASYDHWKDHMILWTTEGSKIDQEIVVSGGGVNVLAVQGGAEARGYPGGRRGNLSTAGYEYFKNLDIVGHAKQTAKEATDLLDAPKCPAKNDATIIVLPGQLMLQMHENGHGFEMDRAYDYEAAYAGTSFMKPHLVDSLMFGNELVTIYGDATYPGGLGTFFYDHEGVKAQKTTLVENGKLVGYLSSRETAPLKGWKRSSGTARASAFDRMPLIRMTNINLKPGDWKYDELVEDTQDGYIMDTNISWSIDDLRLSFQFGTEIGWRVEHGEITGLIKKPSYTGITPKFWNSINAICHEKEFKIYGTPNCGKGEPGQTMYTGHGSPPARFEHVRIGVM